MKSPKAPSPPDPKETAAAQTQSNIGTAIANSMLQGNQVTPYGSLTNEITGYNSFTDPSTGHTYQLPQTTTTTTLSPDQRYILREQTDARKQVAHTADKQAGKLDSVLRSPVQARNLTEISGRQPNLATTFGGTGNIWHGKKLQQGMAGDLVNTYGTDFSEDRQRVEDALMARMNPSLAQERSRLETQLANQGIKLGTEAFDRALAQRGQQENDARMAAILAGGQEQSRLTGLEANRAAFQNQAAGQAFGQNLAQQQAVNAAQGQGYEQALGRATFGNLAKQQTYDNLVNTVGFNNAARQAEFGMGSAARSGAINNMNALLSGGQVTNPVFAPQQGGNMPGIDMAGLINNQYQGQLGNYNAQMQNRNSTMGGLFGLGAAGIMALSDERTKTEIEPLGVEVEGNPVYAYEYRHDPGTRHIGVMAQDVARTKPEAVVPMGRFLGVNYSKLVA